MSRQASSASSSTDVPTRKQKLTGDEKAAAKKEAADELKQEFTPRRSSRFSEKYDNTVGLTLRFTPSQYSGVSVQTLDEQQNIYFTQAATLVMRRDSAPHGITYYYEFRQFVTDSWTFQSGEAQALGPFVQDGPYRPNYTNAQCVASRDFITFNDEPGFSTGSRIAAGKWLLDYEVRFQWQVTALYGGGAVWTSPEVVHRVDSPFVATGGPVIAVPAAVINFEVDLPDRPRDW